MNKIYFKFLIFFLLGFLFCCEKNQPEFTEISASGFFIYKGSATFPTLYFKSKNGKLYQVTGPKSSDFAKYQGKIVKINALAATVILETADHKYKQKRNIIKNIVVTSFE